MGRKQQRRSNCPVNFALETFGDTWSLLIIRDIVYFGKRTYSDFLSSPEGIATNILAARLTKLEQNGMLVKTQDETDRRKDIYWLTEKGLDLIPLMLEMVCWSAKHDPQTSTPSAWITMIQADKEQMIRLIRETVAGGGSIAAGPNSLLNRLPSSPFEYAQNAHNMSKN